MRIFKSLACAGAVFIMAVLVVPPATACAERKPTQETGHGPHDYSFLSQSPTLWKAGDPGEPLFLKARILNTCGQPVEGAEVQVLHANHDGEHEPDKFRGVYRSDKRGQIKFVTVFPGYTGGLPRHIHFIIRHPKHPELVTRLFFKNDPDVDNRIEDLAMVLEEVHRGGQRGWISGFEFILQNNTAE